MLLRARRSVLDRRCGACLAPAIGELVLRDGSSRVVVCISIVSTLYRGAGPHFRCGGTDRFGLCCRGKCRAWVPGGLHGFVRRIRTFNGQNGWCAKRLQWSYGKAAANVPCDIGCSLLGHNAIVVVFYLGTSAWMGTHGICSGAGRSGGCLDGCAAVAPSRSGATAILVPRR